MAVISKPEVKGNFIEFLKNITLYRVNPCYTSPYSRYVMSQQRTSRWQAEAVEYACLTSASSFHLWRNDLNDNTFYTKYKFYIG